VLVHGFTATADEMRPLGEALADAGFPVVGVQLPGHGTAPQALAAVGHREWLACVREAVREVRAERRRVAVAGMSMGALLAVLAAAENDGDVDALVLCGAALTLRNRWLHLLPAAARVPGVTRRWPLLPRRGARGISDPVARAASPAYEAIPWRALEELLALRRAADAALGRVRAPTLALHGRGDRSVPVTVVEHLRRRLASTWFESHVLERSWHVVTLDVERERVAALVVDFLARVSKNAGLR
jgi:carboxylesterase